MEYNFNYMKHRLSLRKAKYKDSDEMALVVIDPSTGERWGVLTVNVPDVDHQDDEFLIKTWSENEKLAEAIFNQGWFEDTGKRAENGRVTVEFWKFKEPHSIEDVLPL